MSTANFLFSKLTARVSNRATDTFVVDRLTSVNVQCALLHHTSSHVSNAVAELARLILVRRYLSAFGVVFAIDRASVIVGKCDVGRWDCCASVINKLNWY